MALTGKIGWMEQILDKKILGHRIGGVERLLI
jgi:hypothetical protein